MTIDVLTFRVTGHVQRVHFRKYTKGVAKDLRLTGWVKNQEDGSVIGLVEGSKREIGEFKFFLAHLGSPLSIIEEVETIEEMFGVKRNYTSFSIRH